mgnify:CR=1 FL=1
MRLAILSDTHGLLRPEVTELLKSADAILHGGDINRQSIVDQLRQYAPLYVVRGNNDKEWAEQLPHDLTVTLGGVTFYLVHNKKEVPADLTGVDAVVFGHSHKYVQEEKDGVLWLNPGSCGPRRFHQEITMMMAQVTGLRPGDFIHTLGDAHIYLNHTEQAAEQLRRTPRPLPVMKLNPAVDSIFGFRYEDFTLEGYDPYPSIKAPIAV